MSLFRKLISLVRNARLSQAAAVHAPLAADALRWAASGGAVLVEADESDRQALPSLALGRRILYTDSPSAAFDPALRLRLTDWTGEDGLKLRLELLRGDQLLASAEGWCKQQPSPKGRAALIRQTAQSLFASLT